MFTAWCQQHELHLFQVHRADIECFGREMESRGRARATIARRLCTVAGFYRYAVEEELLAHSPRSTSDARAWTTSPTPSAWTATRSGRCASPPGSAHRNEHALISLLAINGLRISEALGADIDALGLERGHRTLTILRKGGKIVTIPLALRTARAIDLAIGERLEGPILLRPDGQRMDRHCASRICAGSPVAPASTIPSGPHPAPRLHHLGPVAQKCRGGSRIARRPAHHRWGRAWPTADAAPAPSYTTYDTNTTPDTRKCCDRH